MFRSPHTQSRRLGRLIGAGVVAAGLLISGAGIASAAAPDAKTLCGPFIRDADRLTQCIKDSGASVPGCEDYADGFSLQQCAMLRWNLGFDPLPGSPENPGTPRAGAAPKPAPKAATKSAPSKQKAPTKKKPVKKSTSKEAYS